MLGRIVNVNCAGIRVSRPTFRWLCVHSVVQ
jgi:hypothetical protein